MSAASLMSSDFPGPGDLPGRPLLRLAPDQMVHPPATFYVRYGKRSFDLVVGSVCLVVFAVPMLLMVIVILLTSRGPVFFVQERVGLHLTTFRCFKFRTMVRNAETILQ